MGKIDYDVGDLIEVVNDIPTKALRKGQVFTCLKIEKSCRDVRGLPDGPGVEIDGPRPTTAKFWCATLFRKLPKKSQEFFTGEFHVEPV